MSELASVYDPKQYESKIYRFWEEGGFFHADPKSGKKPFTILMPPPNVTSQLHMGHGAGYTMQDILIRWKRMCGYDALWLPGTDHAGIATQMMVEKALESEGFTRQQIGRDEFTKRLWQWKEKYGGIILDQFRKMGFSCDWDRLAFTMDPKLSTAVRKIFVELYEQGLIYRGERLVNWDPALQTAISDDEVENKEVNGNLWHLKYPIEGKDEFIIVATTRPETMLGDTAVAVHPDDERYKHLIGEHVRLPLTGRLIPVIADSYVKSEFGTGAVKITPAHDVNDFEIGKRHKLPLIDIMNPDGSLNDKTPERFRGKDRFVARKEIIKALKELGLFEKEQSYKHTVPHSERSKQPIEPRLSLQWFVRMQELAAPAIAAAKEGKLSFYPDLWKKTYLHWLENIQDWCISRQLWWGHRVPIWYCDACNATMTGMEDPTHCHQCGSSTIHQDEDVLDTWFSSWLWPVSPFGWPDESEDLAHYYPTDVLVTAPEIIFLWVARMVMVGLKTRGEIPFRDVFLTITVCDKQGRKFSKTLGNGIDPLEVIDTHGTDAVRFTPLHLSPLGGRVRMAVEDFEVGARFVNKLWNAARFLLSHIDAGFQPEKIDPTKLDLPGLWLLDEFANATEKVDRGFSQYRMNDAVDAMYQMIWLSFCDWGLEAAKGVLQEGRPEQKKTVLSLLLYVLDGILRLASPVIPFVTEEIWQKLPAHPDWDRPRSLVIANFPNVQKLRRFKVEGERWRRVQDLVSGIRSVRSQAGIQPKTQLDAFVKCDSQLAEICKLADSDIRRLAGLKSLCYGEATVRPGLSLVDVGRGYETYVPAAGLIDIEKEQKRLRAEIERIKKIVTGLENKLGNPAFVERAPVDVVAETSAQRDNLRNQLTGLEKNLEALS